MGAFWLQILTELKGRVLILCLDGLKGLPEAIATVFPKATIQTCVVHLVRHSLSFVADKEHKAVAADLKPIYQALTEADTLQAPGTLSKPVGQALPCDCQILAGELEPRQTDVCVACRNSLSRLQKTSDMLLPIFQAYDKAAVIIYE